MFIAKLQLIRVFVIVDRDCKSASPSGTMPFQPSFVAGALIAGASVVYDVVLYVFKNQINNAVGLLCFEMISVIDEGF